MEKLNECEFIAIRNVSSVSSFGDECDYTDTIVNYTTNFVTCIQKLNEQRDKDIAIHKNSGYVYDDCMNYSGGFEIVYKVVAYKNIKYENESHPIEWLSIYEDFYNEDDSDDDEICIEKTVKGKYHNIHKEHKANLKKCISNNIYKDKKKLNWKGRGRLNSIGNIDYECVNRLLELQNYKCYMCSDKLITHSYVPYCCYKFSIDRFHDNKPHDKNNIGISCYFCNCVNHYSYDKKIKTKCDDTGCFCNSKLF